MFSSQTLRTYLPWLAAAVLTAVTVTAIVVISQRLASTPEGEGAEKTLKSTPRFTPALTEDGGLAPPAALAAKLLPPSSADGAFDTPFFDGKKAPLTLADLKGQGLVVNFWATWCIPCVREMPALDALAAKLEGRGVQVVTISQDRAPLVKVPAFYEKNHINLLPLYYDEQGSLGRKLDVQALPTTILIDAEGREVGRVLGVLQWNADDVVEYMVNRLAPKGP